MPSLNQITIIGTLAKDPELRQKPNGGCVCKLLVVTDESYTNRQSGEYVEEVEWHAIKLYNKAAEYAYQYHRKGNLIYTQGSKRTIRWKDDTGQTKYFTEIRSFDIKKLDNDGINVPREIPEYTNEPPATPAPKQAASSNTASQSSNIDDEPDALYDEAVKIVTAQNIATVSGLQRILKVGYNRSARLLDTMTNNGILSKETDGTRTVIKAQEKQ